MTRPATTRAQTERPCPSCGQPIRFGDYIKQVQWVSGRPCWVHIDCRGRERAEEQRAESAQMGGRR